MQDQYQQAHDAINNEYAGPSLSTVVRLLNCQYFIAHEQLGRLPVEEWQSKHCRALANREQELHITLGVLRRLQAELTTEEATEAVAVPDVRTALQWCAGGLKAVAPERDTLRIGAVTKTVGQVLDEADAALAAAPAAPAVVLPEAEIAEVMRLVNEVQKNRVCAEMSPSNKDHFNGLAADSAEAIEAQLRALLAGVSAPVLYVSKGQLDNHRDPDGPDSSIAGRYLPARITPAGNFTTPLFAAPQAPAADALDAARRTDAEIVKRTEQAARFLLGWKYGMEPESSDAQLRHSSNTKAQWAWDAACRLQEILTDSDAVNAAQEVDDAAIAAQAAKGA